ncbi:MAG TPA: DUF1772 domain-containing protein [Chitinophagaceae bacterium]|nr:DUF1772 domain-containing protein [Chitinophagaceae bacterium]
MKRFFLFASLVLASGLMLTNVYTSLVDAPAWGHQIPASLHTARQYYSQSNPGTFFRIFSPLNQALGLLSLLLFWKRSPQVRWLLGGAFVFYFIGEGMTFLYFYPLNAVLFGADQTDVALLQATFREWSAMNWVRTAVVAAGLTCSALGLQGTYRTPAFRRASAAREKTGARVVQAG